MDRTLVTLYGVIALVSAVGVYIMSRRLGDARRPPAHRLILSLLAGAVWPLMLVGLVEFGSFAVYAKVRKSHGETN